MKILRLSVALLVLFAVGILTACSNTASKSPDVSDSFASRWIKQASKTSPSVRIATRVLLPSADKSRVRTTSHKPNPLQSLWRAPRLSRNQIVVIPTGVEKETKAVNSDLDKGIEKNLDAALIQNKMHDNVKYDVKSGVVTLTGEVNSQAKRDHAEKVATSVPT